MPGEGFWTHRLKEDHPCCVTYRTAPSRRDFCFYSAALPKVRPLPPRQQRSNAASHQGVSRERCSLSHRRQPAHSREGSGWLGRAYAGGVEVETCITRSGPLVLSPSHVFCGISQWGRLPYTSCSADHQGPSPNTRVMPLQGSGLQVRQLPVAQEM